MVQSIENNIIRPNYNAVKINIKKPEINTGNQINKYMDDSGIYNAVNIEIDNPSINTEPKRIYDYPNAECPVPYAMAQINPIPMPQGFNLAYHTTNVILPKMEQEIEGVNLHQAEPKEEAIIVEEEIVEVPEPNYTTVEAENVGAVQFRGAENIKRPEILPSEEILPEVNVPKVLANLADADYDVQAEQMEEIARISLENPENAVPYIVREIMTSLIDITNKDTSKLATPTDAQIEARKKLITNFLVMENAKQQNQVQPKLPYKLTEQDFLLANELSPMEQAERNKEYALYTIAILAKIYTDEVEKHTGNVVPLTDLPGSAAIVDALRFNPNSGVKIAAIDALRHIQRPEYKEELTTVFTLAQADANPQVSMVAERALMAINNQ